MKDYLDNLVARTLQLSAVVQPRLSSFFEPLFPIPQGTVNASAAPEITHEDKTDAPPAAELSRALPFEKHLAPHPESPRFEGPQITTPKTIEADRGQKLGSSQSSTPRRDQLTISPAQILTSVVSQTPTPAGPSLTTKAARMQGSKTDRHAGRRADPKADPNTVSEPSADALAVGALAVSDSSERSRIDTPAMVAGHLIGDSVRPASRDPIETTPRRALAASVVRSAMRGDDNVLFPTAKDASPFAASETPKTISVTIGRVDVRAVFPPPQAQPTRRAHRIPAPMSLDEYLKQRNEGGK